MTLRIRKWAELQAHRDGRRIIWIKLYAHIKDSRAWLESTDSQRLDMIACLLFAIGKCGADAGEVRNDPDYIKKYTRIDHKPNLQHLIDVEFLIDDQGEESGEGSEESRVERARDTSCNILAHPGTSANFQLFWAAYPKRRGKKAAEAAWRRAKDRPSIQEVIAAIDRAKRSIDWQKNGGQFIPLPATWINQGRWADEYEPPRVEARPPPAPVPHVPTPEEIEFDRLARERFGGLSPQESETRLAEILSRVGRSMDVPDEI